MSPDALHVRFGANIRQLRMSRGMTQQVLAEKSDLSIDAIRRIEHGTISPSLTTLNKLAQGLQISLATLFEIFEGRKRERVKELTDLVARRRRREVQLVVRLVRALFEG